MQLQRSYIQQSRGLQASGEERPGHLLCWAWLAEAGLGDPVVQWEAPLYHRHLQSSSGAKLT